jgi:hypothetical protein
MGWVAARQCLQARSQDYVYLPDCKEWGFVAIEPATGGNVMHWLHGDLLRNRARISPVRMGKTGPRAGVVWLGLP